VVEKYLHIFTLLGYSVVLISIWFTIQIIIIIIITIVLKSHFLILPPTSTP
jgi:hypothetical protein